MTSPTTTSPLFVGFEGVEPNWSFLEEIRPAGVILFTRNIVSVEQLQALCRNLRKLNPQPVIAIDLEGGRVNRLDGILGSFPEPSRFGFADAAQEAGTALGAALNAFGICLNFAPVVDLDFGNIRNGLHSRTLGKDPQEVSHLARHFLLGLRMAGVEGCLKHFPGLGTTKGDSHDTLPTLRDDQPAWDGNEARVYREMAGPEMRDIPLMLAHCRVPFWNDEIASASPKAVDWLRSHDYRGLIITDDLEMKAIDQERIGDYACASMEAGVDAVMVCREAEKVGVVWSALKAEGWLESDACRALMNKTQPMIDHQKAARQWTLSEVKNLWSKFGDRSRV